MIGIPPSVHFHENARIGGKTKANSLAVRIEIENKIDKIQQRYSLL